MFPLGVTGGSQEMTKVVLLADSDCKFITSLASKNNVGKRMRVYEASGLVY